MNLDSIATVVSAICNIINTLKPLAPLVTRLAVPLLLRSDVWCRQFIAKLGDERSAVRQAAVQTLVKAGPKVVPLLIKATADLNGLRRTEAEKVLSRIGVPAIKMMIEARQRCKYDPNGNTVAAGHLERALCQLEATEETVEHLVKLLEDEDCEVRQGAIYTLGGIRALKAIDALSRILTNTSGERCEVREETATAFGKIRDPRVRPLLIETLQNDGDWQVRAAAADALGLIGGHQAIKPLLSTLKAEGDWRVVMSAANAMGTLKADEAVDPLSKLLDHHEPSVKQEAARALGKIGSTRAIPPLVRRIVEDKDPMVGNAVKEALVEIDTGQALAALEDCTSLIYKEHDRLTLVMDARNAVKGRLSHVAARD